MYISFDTETLEWSTSMESGTIIKFLFGCAIRIDNKREIERVTYQTTIEFIDYFRDVYYKYNKSFRIFAHNLKFDFAQVASSLVLYYKLEPVINGGRILSVKCRDLVTKKLHFEFRDSYSLLVLSIKALGETISLPKMPTTCRGIDYCFRDCEILWKSLELLIDTERIFSYDKRVETMNMTISSIAFSIFHIKNAKYNYTNELGIIKNKLTEISGTSNKIFREFFFGGRVEVFDFSMVPVCYVFDVNSEHPHSMVSSLYPEPPYRSSLTTFNLLEAYNEPNVFAIYAEIDERNRNIPLFPERQEGKNIFAATIKKHIIFKKEMEYCIKNNILVKPIEEWNCAGWVDCFNYINDMYNFRLELKEKKDPREQPTKITMNGTYGKLGERAEKDLTVVVLKEKCTLEKIQEIESDGFICQTKDDESLQLYSKKKVSTSVRNNLVYACMITAYSRLTLMKYIEFVLSKGGKVYYCDTDSVFTDVNCFPNKGPETKVIGGMKLDKTLYNYQAVAPKEYISTKLDKLKGLHISKNDKGETVDKQVVIAYLSPEMENPQTRPIGFLESFRRHLPPNSVVTIDKHKYCVYDKRKINKDLTTSPYIGETIDNENMYKKIIKNCIKLLSIAPVQDMEI